MKKTKWGWFGATVFFFLGTVSDAGIVSYFDIDGTLFHDSGIYNGKLPAFITPWVLTRISSPNNGLGLVAFQQAVAKGELPDRILVTRHEMDHILLGKLALGEGQSGSVDPIQLTPFATLTPERYEGAVRPKQIIPGYYMVNDQIAFRFHKDVAPGENVLLDAFTDAFARAEEAPTRYSWKGPAFSYFEKAIETQGVDSRVFLLTDRDSRQASVDALLGKMFGLGAISQFVAKGPLGEDISPKIVSMTDARARVYGSVHEFQGRKAARLEMDMAALDRSPMKHHLTLAADFNQAKQGTMQLMHEVRIFENDPDKVAALLRKARELATNYPRLKIMLFHAGEEATVNGADFNQGLETPSRWVVFTPSGTGWRKPLPIEQKELGLLEGRGNGCSEAVKVVKK